MPLDMTLSIAGLLQWLLALLACAWALRTHKTRVLVVLASVGGAMLGGLFSVVPLIQMAVKLDEGLKSVPYGLVSFLQGSVILGMMVGAGGAVTQTLSRRRAHRA